MTILRAKSLLFAVVLTVGATGCDDNKLSEAQSEVIGFCISYLSLSDSPDNIVLVGQIDSHVGNRFDKDGLEAGATRAAQQIANDGRGTLSTPTDQQISQCQGILSW